MEEVQFGYSVLIEVFNVFNRRVLDKKITRTSGYQKFWTEAA